MRVNANLLNNVNEFEVHFFYDLSIQLNVQLYYVNGNEFASLQVDS